MAIVQFWLAPFTAHEEREKRRNWFFRRPAVHHGFQRSWRANGLSRRVVGRVSQIAAEAAAKGQRLRVITTGAARLSCAACPGHILVIPALSSACSSKGLPSRVDVATEGLALLCLQRRRP